MSSTCTAGNSCTLAFGPYYSNDVNPVTFDCNTSTAAGSYIASLTIAPNSNAGKSLGTIENVICANNTTAQSSAPCLGQCPVNSQDAANVQVQDCSVYIPPGVAGFTGYTGDRIDLIETLCDNGTTLSKPANFSTGGSATTPAECPLQTHRLTAVTGSVGCSRDPSNGGACVTSMSVKCTPIEEICYGETLLTDPMCFDYCSANPGACDKALLDACANPVNYTLPICGCALPDSQYPVLSLNTSNGISVPIACDKRCQSSSAVKLGNTGTCTVGVICVQSNINIAALQSTIGQGISLSQTCGQSSGSTSSTSSVTSFLTSTAGLIIIGIVIAIIVLVVILLVVSHHSIKKKREEMKNQEKDTQRSVERQAARISNPKPTVIRLN